MMYVRVLFLFTALIFTFGTAGDQGLLNEYFDDWATSGPTYRIPVTYNMLPSSIYRLVLISLHIRHDAE
jgi:hypothetical protein